MLQWSGEWLDSRLTTGRPTIAFPHSCHASLHVQYPDLFVQAIVTVMHFFTGHWSIVVLQVAVLAYNLNQASFFCFFLVFPFLHITKTSSKISRSLQYRAGRHVVDVTEIFRQVSKHKKSMYIKTGIYLLAFTWSMYRLVEALVRSLASPGSHAVAQTILKEAAAALHRK